jgi:hypothetical protein
VNPIHLAQDRGQWAGSCQHGNEPSGSIKGGEFLDYLSDLASQGSILSAI